MTSQQSTKMAPQRIGLKEHEETTVFQQDRLAEAIDEFYTAVDAGTVPDRGQLLEKYADVANELADCLHNLDFIQNVAPQLADDDSDQPNANDSEISARVSLGDFRILREIGRGGMGVVYEAEQLSLGRRMALKVLPFAAMLDKQQLKRFKNEARAAATLDHPNTVAVHSVGEERGVHFYAMQLVEGQSLAELIRELRITEGEGSTSEQTENRNPKSEISDDDVSCPPPPSAGEGLGEGEPRDVALRDTKRDIQAAVSTLPAFDSREYFRTVAQLGSQAALALDHAHQNGIVHRDIKPGNLLVDAEGTVFVTDFGLARMEMGAGMTMTGDLLGTLAYMSPEQALAKRAVVDHRTDVYSLGVTLYELLTLQPPYVGQDRQELLNQIAFLEPRRLRQVNGQIPEDLETIVRHAMEKESTERYTTAREMADDLQAFLENRPIAARPPSLTQRCTKWARRNAALVTAAFAVLLMAVVGLATSSWMLSSANGRTAQEKRLAEANLQIAVDAIDRLLTRVGEDADYHGQLHHVDELYAAAAAAYDRVLANTSDANIVLSAAATRARLAGVYDELGRHDRALAAAADGLTLLRTIEATGDAANRELTLRAKMLAHQGKAQIHHDDFASAEWSLSEALYLCEQFVRRVPDNANYHKQMINALNGLAVVRTETGQLEEGRQLLLRAMAIHTALPDTDRNAADYLNDTAGLQCNLATIDRDCGNYQLAEEAFRQAIETQRQAILRAPDYEAYQLDLYNFHWNLADTLIRDGRHQAAAHEVAGMAREFSQRLQPHVEGIWLLQRCIAIAAPEEAKRYRRQSHALLNKTQTATMPRADVQVELAWLLATCPDCQLRDGPRAVRLLEQLSQQGYTNVRLPHTLSAAHLEAGDFDQAFAAARRSLEVSPAGSAHQYVLLALAQAGRGEWDDARQWYAKALAEYDQENELQKFYVAALMDDAHTRFRNHSKESTEADDKDPTFTEGQHERTRTQS